MSKTYMGMPVVLDETFDPDRWDIVRTPEGKEFLEVGQQVWNSLGEETTICLVCGHGPRDRAGTADSDINVLAEPYCWACECNKWGVKGPTSVGRGGSHD